jgi:hypothetical protein
MYSKRKYNVKQKKRYTRRNIRGGGPETQNITRATIKLCKLLEEILSGNEITPEKIKDFTSQADYLLLENKYVKRYIDQDSIKILHSIDINKPKSLFDAIWIYQKIINEAKNRIISATTERYLSIIRKKTGKNNEALDSIVSKMNKDLSGVRFKLMYIMFSYITLLSTLKPGVHYENSINDTDLKKYIIDPLKEIQKTETINNELNLYIPNPHRSLDVDLLKENVFNYLIKYTITISNSGKIYKYNEIYKYFEKIINYLNTEYYKFIKRAETQRNINQRNINQHLKT